MTRLVTTLVAGILFGAGLALSGMTNPAKVLGFLDIAGRWDASLLFVLGGAVGVTVVAFRFVLRRDAPMLAAAFELPTARHIDRPLVIGAALFGVGWGVSGYCPGPGLVSAAAGHSSAILFIVAMLGGMLLQHRMAKK